MGTKKSLTNLILLTLEKSVDGFLKVQDFRQHSGVYLYGAGRDVPKSALSNAFKRLRERGLIEFISDDELAYRLTDQGMSKALWTRMRLGDEKWDGKWRIVIWDIPEKRRKARDLLRHQLKMLGFKKLQNSIWASKKDCAQLLKDYIRKVGIEDWVKVLESDSINF